MSTSISNDHSLSITSHRRTEKYANEGMIQIVLDIVIIVHWYANQGSHGALHLPTVISVYVMNNALQ